MSLTPNRLVAVLTPLLFAPLAGTVSVLAAKHLKLGIESDQLQQIFIAGAVIAFGKAGLWMKGWQDWEKGQSAVPEDVMNDFGLAAAPDPGPAGGEEPGAAADPLLADADLDPDYEDDADDGTTFADDDGFALAGRD